jgi:hypothetical protein
MQMINISHLLHFVAQFLQKKTIFLQKQRLNIKIVYFSVVVYVQLHE